MLSPRIEPPAEVRGGRGSFSAGSEIDLVIENVCDMVSLPMRERVAPKTGERSPESWVIGEVDEAAPVAACSLRLGDPGDGKGTRGFNVSRLCSGHQRARSRFDGSCGSSSTARTPTVVFTVDVSFCRSCFFFRRCNTARSGLSSEASAAAAFRSAAERPPRRSMLLGARAPFRFSLWLLPQMGLTQKPTSKKWWNRHAP